MSHQSVHPTVTITIGPYSSSLIHSNRTGGALVSIEPDSFGNFQNQRRGLRITCHSLSIRDVQNPSNIEASVEPRMEIASIQSRPVSILLSAAPVGLEGCGMDTRACTLGDKGEG